MIASTPVAAESFRLLAFGDSLVAGYGLPADQSFPAQLQRALRDQGYDVQVENAGVSGDTTAGGLARLDWVLGGDPDAAIVVLGANDGLRALDPQKMRANLAAILERFRAEDVPVLLAGMYAPPNLGQEYGQAFNPVFPELAKAADVRFYPFFLEGVAAQAALNQGDGMHPNPEGVAEIVRRILPEVKALLADAGAKPKDTAEGQ